MKMEELRKLYHAETPSRALMERTRRAARRAQKERGRKTRRVLLAAALIVILTAGTALAVELLRPVFQGMGERWPDAPLDYDALEQGAVTYEPEGGMISLMESWYDGGQLRLGVALTLPKTEVREDFGPGDPLFSKMRHEEDIRLFEEIPEDTGTHIISYMLLPTGQTMGEEARFDRDSLDVEDFFAGQESLETVRAMLTFREPLPESWREQDCLELTLTVCRIDRYAYWKGEERYFLSEFTNIPFPMSILRGTGNSRTLSGTSENCAAQGTASDVVTALAFTVKMSQWPAEDSSEDDIIDFALYEDDHPVPGGVRRSAWQDGCTTMWAEYAPTTGTLRAVPVYRQSGEYPKEGFELNCSE